VAGARCGRGPRNTSFRYSLALPAGNGPGQPRPGGSGPPRWRMSGDGGSRGRRLGACPRGERLLAGLRRPGSRAGRPLELPRRLPRPSSPRVIGFDPEMLEATLVRVDCGADGTVAYEYAAGGDCRWCFFAAGERPWRSRRVGQRCRHAVLSSCPRGCPGIDSGGRQLRRIRRRKGSGGPPPTTLGRVSLRWFGLAHRRGRDIAFHPEALA